MSKQKIEWDRPYESACEIQAPDPELSEILNYEGDNKLLIAIRDQSRLEHVIEVANDGWKADYNNHSQPKYFPLHEFVPGVGWRYYDYVHWRTRAFVGSRLLTRDPELTEIIGEKCVNLYSSFLTPIKVNQWNVKQ